MARRVRPGWLSLFAFGALLTAIALIVLLSLETAPLFLRVLVSLSGALTVESLRRAFRKRPPSASQGSAVFGAPPVAWMNPPSGAGSVVLGDYGGRCVALPRTLTLRHGLILGPTGSGKSYGFFLPNMARTDSGSLICTDPKSELWRSTSRLHARVLRFAPDAPEESHAFNWVPLCTDARMAERIARAIVESGQTQRTEQVWLDLEAGFLAALFAHAATLSAPTPLSAYHLITRQKPDALLKSLDESPSEIAREQANLLRQTTERIRGSVIPVVASRLQFLRDPALARFTSAEVIPPDFARLRRTPCATYWCQKESDVTRLRPLSAAFFTVLIEQLMEGVKPVATSDGEVPVTLLLDEFACIGPIPDFSTLIAVARGRGLSFWLGIQSLAQLEALYGSPAARTILTNCQTKLILPGLDIDSAEWVSRSLGQETRNVLRRSWQFRLLSWLPGSWSAGEVEHARPLLTGDEVRRLGDREHLALIANHPPLRLLRLTPRTALSPRAISSLPAALSNTFPETASEPDAGMPALPDDWEAG